ncbi:MAG: hypothetical protein R3F56_14890 [Planctomycetota bacterium]
MNPAACSAARIRGSALAAGGEESSSAVRSRDSKHVGNLKHLVGASRFAVLRQWQALPDAVPYANAPGSVIEESTVEEPLQGDVDLVFAHTERKRHASATEEGRTAPVGGERARRTSPLRAGRSRALGGAAQAMESEGVEVVAAPTLDLTRAQVTTLVPCTRSARSRRHT